MHCTTTPAASDIGAADVHRWHLHRGWSGIGYHFVIRRNGQIEPGRGIEKKGAHVANFNAKSIGISLAGGVASDGQTPVDNFTDDQLLAARDIVLDLMATYRVLRSDVMGHNEVIAKITHGLPRHARYFPWNVFALWSRNGKLQTLASRKARSGDRIWPMTTKTTKPLESIPSFPVILCGALPIDMRLQLRKSAPQTRQFPVASSTQGT